MQITDLLMAFWEWTTDDPVSFYTAVLAVSTILLWIVTWRGIRGQSKDTRIIQRAYLSADLAGINPLRTATAQAGGHVVLAHVDFRNVGHLPARNVTWFMHLKVSTSDKETDFPISQNGFVGNNVIAPGSVMKQGTDHVTVTGTSGFIYVWGQIRYDDGFRKRRTTNFCHRYNCVTLHKMDSGYGIDVGDGRYHQHGNDAD
jgi:hypothetical protein